MSARRGEDKTLSCRKQEKDDTQDKGRWSEKGRERESERE